MKPGEEGLDLPEVTQLRRSGQDSAPGCLSPEPALLLSRARVTALCPGGPDAQLVAGPFSGCSELSVTEAAGLEAPPGCCPPCRSHLLALCLSLEGCPRTFCQDRPLLQSPTDVPHLVPALQEAGSATACTVGVEGPLPGHTREWIWCQKAQVCSGRLHFAG